jgi:lipopolysaccharide/colanic/teichoic acid biosynthesis glycosyltransferase
MYKNCIKRLIDLIVALIVLVAFAPFLLIITVLLTFQNRGSAFFLQERPGKAQKAFQIIKFKSMNDAKDLQGNLLPDVKRITSVGGFVRKYSLDELPQLVNVLRGDMSLVGPRPCLLNQKKLISERKKRKVFKVKPGITGLAQISKITMKTPTLLAKTDLKMINQMNLSNYFYYVFKTLMLIIKKT